LNALLMMLVALAVGAEPLPPTPAPTPTPTPTPTKPELATVRAHVTFIHPSGAVLPGAAATLRIERLRMPRPGEMAEPEVVQGWTATSNAAGDARFEGLPPFNTAESDTLVVRWKGGEQRNALTAPNDGRIEPVNVVVRQPTGDASDLTMQVRLTLTPRDTGMQIEHLIQIENPTHAVIDTDLSGGLVMPLVAPAPGDDPVEAFLPQRPDSREFLMQQNPDSGRLLIERGRLVFRGQVMPEGQMVRIVYLVPFAGSTDHTYGLRLPVTARTISMVVRSPERVLPQIAFRNPAEVLVRDYLGGEERTMLLVDEPAVGQVVLIDVRGTPDRHVFFRPLAAGLGALLVGLLVVLAVGRRRTPSGDSAPVRS